MILNVTSSIYTDNEMIKKFFNLNIKSVKDVNEVKTAILEKLNIDTEKYKILGDGISPEKDIQRNVEYWIKIEKK